MKSVSLELNEHFFRNVIAKHKMLILLSAIIIAAAVLSSLLINFTADAKTEGVFVPIIMYHNISRDESILNDYTITPVTLEKDLIYLRQKGYTSVFISDLIAYVYDGVPLPEKPVVITFDDGNLSNYTLALDVLERQGFKAVFSVTGEFCDTAVAENDENPDYAYMTWSDVKKLSENELAEIANHSYYLHSLDERKGALLKESETYEEYRAVLIADTMKLHDKLSDTGISVSAYTYPYGFFDDTSEHIIRICGYKATLTAWEKPNYITDKESLYGLGRYNRPAFVSTEEFMKKALKG